MKHYRFVMVTVLCHAAFGQGTVVEGSLPRSWNISGPDCSSGIPDWQVHQYNQDLYILREPGCSNYEKPFLYLLFGDGHALLQDTGAGKTDVAGLISRLLKQWAASRGKEVPRLIVVHSHSHGDHTAGDAAIASILGATVIAAERKALIEAFKISDWPNGIGSIDLGGRIIQAIPIPGHDSVDLALYDARTGILFSGDTLYPGRLYITDFAEYVRSIDRLVDFTQSRPVAHILGTHIEQRRTPFMDYVVRTVYQPDEAPLELRRGDLLELQDALRRMAGKPQRLPLARFTIFPRRTIGQ